MDLIKKIPTENLQEMYLVMLKIRIFEERVAQLITPPMSIVCPVHLYIGQEAIATGVCFTLRKKDYVYSTHRSHGHYIAKGGDIKTLMAEMYGKMTGCSKGKGGSMHLASPSIGLPGSPAIVAGSVPLSVGSALAFSCQKSDSVSVSFFGDGAMDEGVVYECFNIAALKKLPVIFVCENNQYATHVHMSKHLADTDICRKAEAFGVPAIRVDGNNVIEVFNAAKTVVQNARSGEGPALLEFATYRWRGHVGPGDEVDMGIRSQEELDYWTSNCPIKKLESTLTNSGILTKSEVIQIHSAIENEIEEAIVFAEKSPFPDIVAEKYLEVYKP